MKSGAGVKFTLSPRLNFAPGGQTLARSARHDRRVTCTAGILGNRPWRIFAWNGKMGATSLSAVTMELRNWPGRACPPPRVGPLDSNNHWKMSRACLKTLQVGVGSRAPQNGRLP